MEPRTDPSGNSSCSPAQAFLPPCPPGRLPESREWRAIPGDFKYPQEPNASQHRDAQRGHDLGLHQDGLQDAPAHDEAVKAVEEGHEVGLQAQAVHLQQHLRSEQGQERLVGCVWQVQEWDGIQTGVRGGEEEKENTVIISAEKNKFSLPSQDTSPIHSHQNRTIRAKSMGKRYPFTKYSNLPYL